MINDKEFCLVKLKIVSDHCAIICVWERGFIADYTIISVIIFLIYICFSISYHYFVSERGFIIDISQKQDIKLFLNITFARYIVYFHSDTLLASCYCATKTQNCHSLQ